MIQQFIIDILLALYSFTGDLGLSIIFFTILVRTLLLPISMPSLYAAKRLKAIQPEIRKLKDKYSDKKELQLAQIELYKKYNVNPLAGCLPQIVQLIMLIILYRALTAFLKGGEINGVVIDPQFLWLNLTQSDPYHIFPFLAGLTQFILSLIIAPGAEIRDIVPNNSKKKKIKEENKKEEDMADMAQQMQQQMLYLLPIMTGVIAINFPSGLALYWVVTTIFSIGQQLVVSGPGGLVVYSQRAINFVQSKLNSK